MSIEFNSDIVVDGTVNCQTLKIKGVAVTLGSPVVFGTTSGTTVEGNDTRLDAGTITVFTHASNHTNGQDNIQLATASQAGLMTSTQVTKLNGISTDADVTNASNVSASEGLLKSDTTIAGAGFLDLIISRSDTKIAVQSEIKSYIDTYASTGGLSMQDVIDFHMAGPYV